MTKRRFTVLTFVAFAFAALLAPASEAQAQSVWDVLRDRSRDQRDQRDQRDDDYYGRGRRGDRISDSERRQLRDVARRLDDRARDFERELDRALDRSRYDDRRREDRINDQARQLRDAARRFRNVAGESNDLHRSRDEARRLINEASQIERTLSRIRIDSRVQSRWSQLRSDLRWVAELYGIRNRDFDGGYGRDRDWRY
ncbi:MAG TPA: hypothetical protein VEY09_08550 [Pyrinomonadaceae bacterium]|nr:hypothetical protein [Pyrinomonadaceae bacterium]